MKRTERLEPSHVPALSLPPPSANPPIDPAGSAPAVSAVRPALTWHLAFPPEMEARFEADTGRKRARELVSTGLTGLLVYNLFLINDLLTRPEVMHLALFWRLAVVTPYGLLTLALVARGLGPAWREAVMVSSVLMAMFGSGMIFHATTSSSVAYDPFTFTLFFLVGQILFRLRAPAALAFAALGILLAVLMLAGHPALPVTALSFALGVMLATAVFTTLAGYRLERAERLAYLLIQRETERSQAALQTADAMTTLSQTDALTQVANRRAFDQELPRRWDEAARRGHTLAALMIDIDHFKRFNDRHGHPAGDACLRQVVAVMRANLREGDFLARIGGEEFAVLISGGTAQGATAFAERLRDSVQRAAITGESPNRSPGDETEVVTISIGVAQTRPVPTLPPSQLIDAADSALYQAKHQGRNGWALSTAPFAAGLSTPG